MMKIDFKLSYYLEDLNRLKEISIHELDKLAEMFPAVANIHFLRAKKYQLEGITNNLDVFEKLAFLIYDHGHLYQRMLNSETEIDSNTQKRSTITTVEPTEEINAFESELAKSIETLKALELGKGLEEENAPETDITFDKKTEQQAYAEKLDIKMESPDQIDMVANEMIEKIPGKIENVYEMDEEEISALSPFSKWLLSLNPEANLEEIISADIQHGDEKSAIAYQQGNEVQGNDKKKKKKKKKKNKKKKTEGALEPNIKTKHKQKKKKKKVKDISIKQRAKRSLELSQELVTEPLAELLASQGHTEEAIIMFTKLSLIFPKKSSYFAVRINALKNN